MLGFSANTKNGNLQENRQGCSSLASPRTNAATRKSTTIVTPLFTSVYVKTNKLRSISRKKNESVNSSETQIVEGVICQCTSILSLLAQMLN